MYPNNFGVDWGYHFKGWESFRGRDHFEGMSFETTQIHF